MRHLFIINPRSFPTAVSLDAVLGEIENSFADQGEWPHEVQLSWYPRDAIGLIRKWARKFPQDETIRVYAVG